MGMAAITLFFFFVLLHPFLLYSFEDEELLWENCPFFQCGNFSHIHFPFTNTTRPPYCGHFVVEGCDKNNQTIQLERGGKRYDLENILYGLENISHDLGNISQNDTIVITDKEFEASLNSKSCGAFNNLSFPTQPHASFQIVSSILTLFKCDSTGDRPPHFNFSHTVCSGFTIFYTYQNITNLPSPPPNCAIVQLPVDTSRPYHDIFELLTAKFSLEVRVWHPPELKEENRGHQNNVGLKLGLGLGLGCPAAILIIFLSINFIWRGYKRRRASSNLLVSHTSDPSSKSDTEGLNVYFGVPIFSYTQLEEATNNFDSELELVNGGFGTVYYGKLRDGREVAVKRLYEHNYKRLMQFINEIQILTRLRHKNLVSLYGCNSRRSRDLLLVYEYIPNGTVADHLHGERAKSSPLTWPIRMRIAIETAYALAYLHASDIIHRDVKTNNILLDNNFCVKVADFGLSRLFPNDVTHISTAPQGTPGYVDPEYHRCYQLTDKSDVYSFGVVLIELISSMPAVDMSRHRQEINLATLAFNKIQKGAFDELIDQRLGYQSDEEVQRMTTSIAELAFLCLQQDKELRPCMNEVLKELVRIESGGHESEIEEKHYSENEGMLKSIASPPSSPHCEDSLLKNIQPLYSPNSVTQSWVSSGSSVQKNSG